MEKIKIEINNQKKKSQIIIGDNILRNISDFVDFSKYSSAVIITNKLLAELFIKKLISRISIKVRKIILDDKENQKKITTVLLIWKKLHQFLIDRNTLIINLGGGVISDLGGFAASTYMRGLNFINIPTTLLSQVDASIGGKTGFNHFGIKNLIGTFSQPMLTIIDIATLSTLPKRIFISGFAEMVKHAVIADKKYFEFIAKKIPADFTKEELKFLIKKSCLIKAEIIKSDEEDKIGIRQKLNLGHSIGHAVESLSLTTKKPFLHGEAVAIGLVAESNLAYHIGLLSKLDFLKIKKTIMHCGLPYEIKDISIDQLIQNILTDKKNKGGRIFFSLPKKIGEVITNVEVDLNLIIKKYLL